MALSYAWEKLHSAVLSLASSTAPIQKRLEFAMLAMHTLKADDLPKDNRQEFSDIVKKLTSTPAKGNEGTIAASTAALSDDDAVSIAEQIVSLYDSIARTYGIQDHRE